MKKKPQEKPPGIDVKENRITFDYIKSNFFRVIHVDGIIGGISPRAGLIQMSMWNDRWPIPKQATYELTKDGTLGEEIISERVQRDAVVREVEVIALMDIDVAKQMRSWLDDQITTLDKAMKKKPRKPKRKMSK